MPGTIRKHWVVAAQAHMIHNVYVQCLCRHLELCCTTWKSFPNLDEESWASIQQVFKQHKLTMIWASDLISHALQRGKYQDAKHISCFLGAIFNAQGKRLRWTLFTENSSTAKVVWHGVVQRATSYIVVDLQHRKQLIEILWIILNLWSPSKQLTKLVTTITRMSTKFTLNSRVKSKTSSVSSNHVASFRSQVLDSSVSIQTNAIIFKIGPATWSSEKRNTFVG